MNLRAPTPCDVCQKKPARFWAKKRGDRGEPMKACADCLHSMSAAYGTFETKAIVEAPR